MKIISVGGSGLFSIKKTIAFGTSESAHNEYVTYDNPCFAGVVKIIDSSCGTGYEIVFYDLYIILRMYKGDTRIDECINDVVKLEKVCFEVLEDNLKDLSVKDLSVIIRAAKYDAVSVTKKEMRESIKKALLL